MWGVGRAVFTGDMGKAERERFLLPTSTTLGGPVGEAGVVAPSPQPGLLR